jgi:hypothetical protein
MKKLVSLTLLVIVMLTLGACAGTTSEPTDEMINPGDRIGDFLVTTGKEGDVIYSWELVGCTEHGREEPYFCEATVGTKINISIGIYEDTSVGTLDELWSDHTYELLIENRPVNLQAFGFIEVNHPYVGKMRHWNIVIITDKSGELSLRDSGMVGGDSFESSRTYIFSEP